MGISCINRTTLEMKMSYKNTLEVEIYINRTILEMEISYRNILEIEIL